LLLFLGSLLPAAVRAQEGALARIVVRNPLAEAVTGAGVAVPLRSEWVAVGRFWVQEGYLAVPCQADDLTGDGKPDELFFQLDLPPGGSRTLTVWPLAQPVIFPPRVHAFVQRSDQLVRPVWESELLGFRGSGAATVEAFSKVRPLRIGEGPLGEGGTEEPAFPVGDGVDLLPAGAGLGAAGVFLSEYPEDRARMTRPWTADSADKHALKRPYHVAARGPNDAEFQFRVLADGPVRAVLQADVTNWRTARGQYEARLLYLMEAGKRYCEVRVQLRRLATRSRELSIGSGFAQLPGEVAFDHSDSWMYAVSREELDPTPNQAAADWRGLALWWEANAFETAVYTEEDEGNHLVILQPNSSRTVRTWHAAAWEKDGGVTSADQWRQYVERTARELASPPVVLLEIP
jgi:hypothetical protein